MSWRTTTAWVGGVASALVAMTLLVDGLAFDHEVLAAEARIRQETQEVQKEVLSELLTQQKLQTQQSQQQFYTLRIEFLEAEIDRLQDKLLVAPPKDQWWLQERISRQTERLDQIRHKLDGLMLNASP